MNAALIQANPLAAQRGGMPLAPAPLNDEAEHATWAAHLQTQQRRALKSRSAGALAGVEPLSLGRETQPGSSLAETPSKKPAVKKAEDALAGHTTESAADAAAQELRTPDESVQQSPSRVESRSMSHEASVRHPHTGERATQSDQLNDHSTPTAARPGNTASGPSQGQTASQDNPPQPAVKHGLQSIQPQQHGTAPSRAGSSPSAAAGQSASLKGSSNDSAQGRVITQVQSAPVRRESGVDRASQFKGLLHAARATSEAAEERTLVHQMGAGVSRALRAPGPITMVLRPEHLGEVTIKVSMVEEQVRAEFTVRSELARELLNNTSHELRASLEHKGISVGEVHVRLGAPDGVMENPEGAQDGQQHGGAAGSRDHPQNPRGQEPDADAGEDGERTDAFASSGQHGDAHPGVLRVERDPHGHWLVRLNALA